MTKTSKKILTKEDILTGLLCLVGILPGLICYNKMPESIPIHFDINNQPNSYAPKPFVIFVLPLIMIVLHLICCIGSNQLDNGTNPRRVEVIARLIIPTITIVLETATVMFVLNLFTDIGLICCILMGILLIILGNYMPKSHPNRSFGIKLPWTISNEEVWHKTHRLAGWTMVIGGIIMIIMSFIGLTWQSILVVVTALIIPIIYSYVISKKNK